MEHLLEILQFLKMIQRDPSSYVRILVLQHKDASKIPNSDAELNSHYFIGDNGILDYNAPLLPGASTYDKILKYKKFKISSYNPNVIHFKFVVYPYNNVYTKCDNFETGDAKGAIYCAISGYQHGSQTPLLLGTTILSLRARIIYHDN